MKQKKSSDIIPDQQTGKAIDAESEIDMKQETEAQSFFAEVKNRLQNVNHWKEYAGNLSATFQLVDQSGGKVNRAVQKGDYFKIDIPGPGTTSGEGYDWVQVEEVEHATTPDGERFGFRVRPTDNPQNNKQDVAHFYSEESTSSFIIERKGSKITASVHDRNTKPNADADATVDKIRHAVVGTAGAAAFSKVQWKKLTDGLLKK
ncbi:MAG TPA: hypothetical protein VFD46_12575 [Chryseolinea sp.]|nr:hypothetical protein [Chryseolinea sp.]